MQLALLFCGCCIWGCIPESRVAVRRKRSPPSDKDLTVSLRGWLYSASVRKSGPDCIFASAPFTCESCRCSAYPLPVRQVNGSQDKGRSPRRYSTTNSSPATVSKLTETTREGHVSGPVFPEQSKGIRPHFSCNLARERLSRRFDGTLPTSHGILRILVRSAESAVVTVSKALSL